MEHDPMDYAQMGANLPSPQGKSLCCDVCYTAQQVEHKAIGFCQDCKHFLCNFHFNKHGTREKFASHISVKIDEQKQKMYANDDNDIPIQLNIAQTNLTKLNLPAVTASKSISPSPSQQNDSTVMCKDHSEELKLFCETCSKAMCSVCTSSLHKGHRYQFIEEMLELQMEKMEDLVKRMKRRAGRLKESFAITSDSQKKREERQRQLKTNIREAFQKQVVALRAREDYLLQQLDTICPANAEALGQSTKRVQKYLDIVAQQEKYAQKLTNGEDVAGMIGFCEKLMALNHRMKEVSVEHKNGASEAISTVTFEADPKPVEAAISSFGCIADPTRGLPAKVTPVAAPSVKVTASLPMKQAVGPTQPPNPAVLGPNPPMKPLPIPKVVIPPTIVQPRDPERISPRDRISPKQVPSPVAAGPSGVIPSGRTSPRDPVVAPERISPRDRTAIQGISPRGQTEVRRPTHVNAPLASPPAVRSSHARNATEAPSIGFIEDVRRSSKGKVASFTIAPRNSKCILNDTKLAIRIRGPCGDVPRPKILKMKDGKIQVDFIPCYMGRYIVEVATDREKIDGSPFDVISLPLPRDVSQIGTSPKQFGSHGSDDGNFRNPTDMAVNARGDIFVADTDNHRIQIFNSCGTFLNSFGSKGNGDGQLSAPSGITVNHNDEIVVADNNNHRVQIFAPDGRFVRKFGSKGSGEGQFNYPVAVAINSRGYIIVSDRDNDRVQIFTPEGKFVRSFGSEGSGDGQFKSPFGLTVLPNDKIAVADKSNHRIQVFDRNGTFLRKFGSQGKEPGKLNKPTGVAVDSAGNFIITERENHRIQVFNPIGSPIHLFGSYGTAPGEFSCPHNVVLNENGQVLVADRGNRIQML
eukprot:TRINITY_DN3935_c0_g1_i1.p1 TRINITY_DN3935_c0_g1~~TRINITY_DN3935_c0_g1_i1.p1  ORF type:complete len:865 (+),score=193.23 TRINITY_DN3935_c0_g1_i1:94-2688(+)